MLYENITELIGKTPIVKINNYSQVHMLSATLMLKLEAFNPGGSAKDRVALRMINDATHKGIIKKGATIIEPTSGNTGIGLAMVAASLGFKTILVMPDTMSVERRKILSAYGAKIVLTPGKDGMSGAIRCAEELQKETPRSFIPSQFDNPSNPLSHYETTGPEILEDCPDIDVFVASVGTGGAISGVAKFLKEKKDKIEIVAVEPADSPLISKGISAPHKIQGIGANFIPDNYDASLVDKVLTATTDDAYTAVRELAHLEGIFVGISAGATLSVAKRLAKEEEYKGKKIVVLASDTGTRYLSCEGLINE